jgi:branched-chain amino acid transport system permease protein
MNSNRLLRHLPSTWPVFILGVGLTSVVMLTTLGSPTAERVGTTMLINLIIVVGLYTFSGLSGVFNFGHIAFMAIGAYVSAWLSMSPGIKTATLHLPGFLADVELSLIPSTLIAACVAAGCALLAGYPLMRLIGVAAGIGTLSLLIIIYVVASNWDAFTGGRSAIIGVPVDVELIGALPWALAAMALAFLVQRSRLGLRLQVAREDEYAAQALGIRLVRDRVAAFVISAFILGGAGSLFAHTVGSFTPNAFYFKITFLTWAMLIVGGLHSLSGAVIGTVLISAVSETLRRLEGGFDLGSLHIPGRAGTAELVLASVVIAILVFRPRGITGGQEIYWPWSRTAIDPGFRAAVVGEKSESHAAWTRGRRGVLARRVPGARAATELDTEPSSGEEHP